VASAELSVIAPLVMDGCPETDLSLCSTTTSQWNIRRATYKILARSSTTKSNTLKHIHIISKLPYVAAAAPAAACLGETG